MSTHSLIVILYFLELCEKKTIVGVKVTSSLVYHRKTRRISVVNYFTSSLLVMVLLLFFFVLIVDLVIIFINMYISINISAR